MSTPRPDDETPAQADLARIVTWALLYCEDDDIADEVGRVNADFEASDVGKIMPLYTYAFPGDAAQAVRRYLQETFTNG